jgi:hypothetical protein
MKLESPLCKVETDNLFEDWQSLDRAGSAVALDVVASLERLDTDLLSRRLVRLSIDDKVRDATVFSKNGDCLP